jgi:hypothetical protein
VVSGEADSELLLPCRCALLLLLFFLFPCAAAERKACFAREVIPAAVPEPELSPLPLGWGIYGGN